MATMPIVALSPAYRRIGVREFLAMDFGGAKAELAHGLIYMMAGGNERHAAIAMNIATWLRPRIRDRGCRPYGSDFAVRTGEDTIRYPYVSVYCGNPGDAANHRKLLIGDPMVVFEILSRSTADVDEDEKLPEYRALAGVEAVVIVDADRQRVRLVRRTGPEGWIDDWLPAGQDVELVMLGVSLPFEEIFALD